MSRKKETIEKLLEKEIVSEEEQPYEIPENWAWVRLEKLTQKITDGAHRTPTYTDSGIPFISVKDINKGEISFENTRFVSEETHLELSKRCNPEVGDILVTKSGTIGRLAVVNTAREFSLFVSVALIKPIRTVINSKFLELFLTLSINQIVGKKYIKGSSIQNLHLTEIKKIEIPLPSMQEQKRIAEKVERLLNKIEEAKQLIEETKEIFALRRAAILDKAFRGKLTNSWRNVNLNIEDAGELYEKIKANKTIKRKKTKEISENELRYQVPSTWRWVRLGDVFTITSGGTPKRTNSEYYNGDISWIKTGEIKWNYISRSEECITSEAVSNSSAKLLPKGTVLVAMYGQGLTRGRAAILNIDATCNQAVCALIPNDFILPEFLYFYFMEGYQRFRQIAKGGNQENLSATLIADFLFPLPPLEEQRAIIDILNSILNKENLIMESIKLEDNIKRIRESILFQAFRGELGTSDSNEGNVLELLKEIFQE